jgi:hypothetical protein
MRPTLTTTLPAICAVPVAGAAGAQKPVTNGVRAVEPRRAKNIVDAADEMLADKYGVRTKDCRS